jgi:hypothetical protein
MNTIDIGSIKITHKNAYEQLIHKRNPKPCKKSFPAHCTHFLNDQNRMETGAHNSLITHIIIEVIP